MQTIRRIISADEVVIGCTECGVVQLLVDGQVHRCGDAGCSPFAVTLDGNRLMGTPDAVEPELVLRPTV